MLNFYFQIKQQAASSNNNKNNHGIQKSVNGREPIVATRTNSHILCANKNVFFETCLNGTVDGVYTMDVTYHGWNRLCLVRMGTLSLYRKFIMSCKRKQKNGLSVYDTQNHYRTQRKLVSHNVSPPSH